MPLRNLPTKILDAEEVTGSTPNSFTTSAARAQRGDRNGTIIVAASADPGTVLGSLNMEGRLSESASFGPVISLTDGLQISFDFDPMSGVTSPFFTRGQFGTPVLYEQRWSTTDCEPDNTVDLDIYYTE